MRSSSALGIVAAGATVALLTAAAFAMPPSASAAQSMANESATGCDPTRLDRRDAIHKWQGRAQALPLVAALAAGQPYGTCSFAQRDGQLQVNYLFPDGSRLSARSEPTIEYVAVEADLATPLAADPANVLAATERALFGSTGCGIDWARPSLHPTARGQQGTRFEFTGTSCNCKAAIDRTPAAVATSLSMSAAC